MPVLTNARPSPQRDIIIATLVPLDEQSPANQAIQAMLADNPYVPKPIKPAELPPEQKNV